MIVTSPVQLAFQALFSFLTSILEETVFLGYLEDSLLPAYDRGLF